MFFFFLELKRTPHYKHQLTLVGWILIFETLRVFLQRHLCKSYDRFHCWGGRIVLHRWAVYCRWYVSTLVSVLSSNRWQCTVYEWRHVGTLFVSSIQSQFMKLGLLYGRSLEKNLTCSEFCINVINHSQCKAILEHVNS